MIVNILEKQMSLNMRLINKLIFKFILIMFLICFQIAILGAHEYFGEEELITGEKRKFTVKLIFYLFIK